METNLEHQDTEQIDATIESLTERVAKLEKENDRIFNSRNIGFLIVGCIGVMLAHLIEYTVIEYILLYL